MGIAPEVSSQRISVGIILVVRLGARVSSDRREAGQVGPAQ